MLSGILDNSYYHLSDQPGQVLFKKMCAPCHTIGGGDHVGPDLRGVADRRDLAWLTDFMKDYVGAFEGAGIVGLTGTPEQVAGESRRPIGSTRSATTSATASIMSTIPRSSTSWTQRGASLGWSRTSCRPNGSPSG